MQQLWVIAGPNGAGKSTLANRYISGRLPLVNPDIIAARNPTIGPLGAGKYAIEAQKRLLAQGKSFAWETTLSGKREVPFMHKAKAAGYKVNFVFIGLETPEFSIARIAARVASGGHHIETAEAKRRFERSMANVPAAIAAPGRVLIFDNSDKRRRLLLSPEYGNMKYRSKTPPDWAVKILWPELPP